MKLSSLVLALIAAALIGLCTASLAGAAWGSQTSNSQSPDEADEQARAEAEYWGANLPMHPKLVHVPIALCILMPFIAIGLVLAKRLGWISGRVLLIAAALQVVTLATSLGALKTGHDDAEEVEGYASQQALDTHDQRAHWFVYVAGFNVFLAGLVLLARNKRKLESAALALFVVGLFAQSYAGYKVGDAGGRLVYVSNASDAHK